MTTRPDEVSERGLRTLGMRFVLVNERSPRAEAFCSVCCTEIDRGYVRDRQTRLLYCNAACFAEHEWMGNSGRGRNARRAS